MTKKFVCTRKTIDDETNPGKKAILVEGQYVDDLEQVILDDGSFCGVDVLPDPSGEYIIEPIDSDTSSGIIYTRPSSQIRVVPNKDIGYIKYTHNETKTIFHVYEGDTRIALFKGETGVIPLEELSINHKTIFIDLKTDFAKIYAKFEEDDGQTILKVFVEEGTVVFKDYLGQELFIVEENSIFTLDSEDNVTVLSGNVSFLNQGSPIVNEDEENGDFSNVEHYENDDYHQDIRNMQGDKTTGCGCNIMVPQKINIPIDPLPFTTGLFFAIALISTHNRIFRVLFRKKKINKKNSK